MLKGFGSHFRFTGRGSIAAFVLRPLPIAAVASLGLFAAQASAAKPDLERSCARYVADGVRVAECVDQLRLARDATAKYRDPQAALRDGFVPGECEEHPGAGAMGEHWLRVDRMGDQKLDPREPEILLYISTPTGRRLVGAEWSIAALEGGLPHYGTQPPDPNRTSPPPRMFGGRSFDGPMQGHNLIQAWPSELHLTPQPWHYDLHVWLWEENAAGVFAQYNPRARCKPGVAPEGRGGSGTGDSRRWTCHLRRLHLTVSPRRAGAGKRTSFRFRATAGRKPVRGVRIRFAGRRVRTGRGGLAKLVRRLSRPGRYRVMATKRNLARATATVRVVR